MGVVLEVVLVIQALAGAGPAADRALADAAMYGDAAGLERLLDAGADVGGAQADGMTALHWAAERGDEGLARLLIGAGAPVDAITRVGAYRPLHLAARGRHEGVVRALLSAGADPRARTATGGVTALHLAAASGSPGIVVALIEHGAVVDARDEAWGRTPLMFAAAAGRVEAVETLLAHGADTEARADVVDLPTVAAGDRMARLTRNEVLAAFRNQAGPGDEAWRPTPAQVQEAVRAAQQVQLGFTRVDGNEPAEEAAGEGEVGGFPAQVGTQGGLTALLYAAREGHAATALALLEGGADIDGGKAGDGTTPLLIAIANGHFDLASRLLELGADPNATGPAGVTPLYAVINLQWAPFTRYPQPRAHDQQATTYLELMAALLEAGADPNARLTGQLWFVSYTYDQLRIDFTGATPFWRAAYATDVDAMQLLASHGAEAAVATVARDAGRGSYGGAAPAPESDTGVWPLHAASGAGYGEGYAANSHRHVPDGWLPAVRYLVEVHGADVNQRDHNGYTPLHHAAARGDNDLIRYLVERGADVTAVSRRGQTTADMANGPVQRISPFPETVRLLESLGSKNNNRCLSC